jgi:D-glycero-alpha-D-manno-heptose-7-phosphate kinase
MIITRTPFRVSFAGGGSDLREFYLQNGYGAVVSAAIQKYMYIIIHPYFHDKIRVKYSRTEDVYSINEIQHPIVRECLRKVEIEKGLEIASFADVPAGTGLGSSSAFTVGLLNALYAYKGKVVSKEQLAYEACEIEINKLGEPIGKQDQYAVSFGNINYIKFNSDESVFVSPIVLSEIAKNNLEKRLCLYHVEGERKASQILLEQKNNIQDKFKNIKNLVNLTNDLKDLLQSEKFDSIGNILHQGWLYKRELASNISNSSIDSLYDKALKYGADGGKLLGAGGNGFLLLSSNNHENLKQYLSLKVLPFCIDREGTKIIFYE